MRFICIFIFVTSVTCFNTSAQEGSKTSDIEYLRKQLPILHKNLFHKITKEDFNKQLDLLEEEVGSIITPELAFRLQTIITKVGDSHTGIDLSKFIDKQKTYPLKLYWLKDGFYVTAVEKAYEKILGQKLMAINNISIDEILKRCEDIIVKDNDAIMKQNVPNLIQFKEVLQYLKIAIEGDNTFSFSGEGGRTDIIINTISDLNHSPDYVKIIPSITPLYLRNGKKYFWYEFLKENNILYAQYNSCWGKEVELQYGGSKSKAESMPSFKEFSDSIFSIISKNRIDKFIFDLRFNSGGSSPQGTEFVNRIAALSELNKKGKIFVIPGRRTFSSAILNAMDFKNNTAAIFVGECTGGSPNHFGEVRMDKLPYTGIIFRYSTKYFKRTDDEAATFEPDVIVEPRIDDYKKGLDPVLEYIINYKDRL